MFSITHVMHNIPYNVSFNSIKSFLVINKDKVRLKIKFPTIIFLLNERMLKNLRYTAHYWCNISLHERVREMTVKSIVGSILTSKIVKSINNSSLLKGY